jgi:hypothetical protein
LSKVVFPAPRKPLKTVTGNFFVAVVIFILINCEIYNVCNVLYLKYVQLLLILQIGIQNNLTNDILRETG